jgi:hypothetical protein
VLAQNVQQSWQMISLIAAELVPMGILKDLLAVKNLDVVVANYVCRQAYLYIKPKKRMAALRAAILFLGFYLN